LLKSFFFVFQSKTTQDKMICFPNAKINLGLNVVEKRIDGYHNIETIFLPIELEDALEIIPQKDINNWYEWNNSGLIIDTPHENNICIKALKALRAISSDIPPLKIHLHKHIPFGAGLGGGSADGAFMLKLLNHSFNLGLTNDQLKEIASTLGADCPFFIDNKPSFATGIGNILTPLNIDLSTYHIGIIIPDIHVSTPEAYSKVKPCQPKVRLIDAIQQPIEEWRDLISNDFEQSVFPLYPVIEDVKNYMYKSGAVYASMSGSGSSVFGIFKNSPTLNYNNYFTWISNQ
jgi:4-diphosphocytidyl-2-C-methyl-D-erythritol kinase